MDNSPVSVICSDVPFQFEGGLHAFRPLSYRAPGIHAPHHHLVLENNIHRIEGIAQGQGGFSLVVLSGESLRSGWVSLFVTAIQPVFKPWPHPRLPFNLRVQYF